MNDKHSKMSDKQFRDAQASHPKMSTNKYLYDFLIKATQKDIDRMIYRIRRDAILKYGTLKEKYEFLIEMEERKKLSSDKNKTRTDRMTNGNMKTYSEQYRKEKREQILNYHKEYRKNNKELILERQRKFRERHKEKLNEKYKIYRDNNKERLQEYKRQHYRKQRDKMTKEELDEFNKKRNERRKELRRLKKLEVQK